MAWESRAWKLRSSKGYWDPKGALGKIQVCEIKAATPHPPPSSGAQRRGHRVVSTPQCDHNSDLGSHSCHPITLTVIHLLKKSLWWNGPLRAWRAFQDPAPAESPRNPGASVQGCTQANLLLLLAACDLTECWVDSWGLPKTPKALCLCCNSCILLSLLCPADHLDPHWTRFLLTPTVSLAISLSLTSVFTRKIIEKKVTRQSGHHLTGSDCLQLSGQGQHHPGREQRWGARADSIITTLNCPQRLQVTHRSERKMSS